MKTLVNISKARTLILSITLLSGCDDVGGGSSGSSSTPAVKSGVVTQLSTNIGATGVPTPEEQEITVVNKTNGRIYASWGAVWCAGAYSGLRIFELCGKINVPIEADSQASMIVPKSGYKPQIYVGKTTEDAGDKWSYDQSHPTPIDLPNTPFECTTNGSTVGGRDHQNLVSQYTSNQSGVLNNHDQYQTRYIYDIQDYKSSKRNFPVSTCLITSTSLPSEQPVNVLNFQGNTGSIKVGSNSNLLKNGDSVESTIDATYSCGIKYSTGTILPTDCNTSLRQDLTAPTIINNNNLMDKNPISFIDVVSNRTGNLLFHSESELFSWFGIDQTQITSEYDPGQNSMGIKFIADAKSLNQVITYDYAITEAISIGNYSELTCVDPTNKGKVLYTDKITEATNPADNSVSTTIKNYTPSGVKQCLKIYAKDSTGNILGASSIDFRHWRIDPKFYSNGDFYANYLNDQSAIAPSKNVTCSVYSSMAEAIANKPTKPNTSCVFAAGSILDAKGVILGDVVRVYNPDSTWVKYQFAIVK